MPGRRRLDIDEVDEDLSMVGAKKRRLDFGKGSITKVKVKNFMTYGLAEFNPGSRLNLVLGPNGSGKSSLVNAICLGLAGHPRLLGRADNLRDFVLRGEETGQIDIWLRTETPGKDTRITRLIRRSDNGSIWRINGAVKTLKEVEKLVSEMGVQLDNLCQFMPQDKVQEFARLKPRELLTETQRAIGDARLYELHHDLIEGRKEFVTNEMAANTGQEELERLEKANDALKRDVSRFEHKAELESQIEKLKGQEAWIDYDKAVKDLKESEKMIASAQEKLTLFESKSKTNSAEYKAKDTKAKAAEKEARKKENILRSAEKDIDDYRGSIDSKAENMRETLQKIQGAEEEYQKLQTDIAKLQKELSDAEEALAQYEADTTRAKAPDHSKEIAKLDKEYLSLRQAIVAINSTIETRNDEKDQLEKEEKELKDRVKGFDDAKEKRLMELDGMSRFKGIADLARWLQNNKAMFKGPVFGPVATEIQIDNPLHCQFLENACSLNLWGRFITTCNEDQDLLGKESRERFKFDPIVTKFQGNTERPIDHPCGEPSQYAVYHITHTLDQLFEAPHLVKLVMCDESGLQSQYCGTTNFDPTKLMDDHPKVLSVYTKESHFQRRTSRYNSAAVSTTISPLKFGNVLKPNESSRQAEERRIMESDLANLKQRREELGSEINECQRLVSVETSKWRDCGDQRKKLTAEQHAAKTKKEELKSKIKSVKTRFENKKRQEDPRDQIPGWTADLEAFKQNLSVEIPELVRLHQETLEARKIHVIQGAIAKELKGQMDIMDESKKKNEGQISNFKRTISNSREALRLERKDVKTKKEAAEGLTGPMTEELKAELAKLPIYKDEIQAMINQKEREIDAIHLANPRAMTEYVQRREQIEALKKRLSGETEELDKMRARMIQMRDEWLPTLRKTVHLINNKFQECFTKIGCVGEVLLYEEPSTTSILEDFEKFAIHIRVRYRETESLQLLDQHRQSGGERSVATILYLISLQGVTVCPFRVVDEINQGMDPINERKCFMQLVEHACQPNTPQCFLLTPKLLPNLPYSEYITLLQINNGATIKEAAKDFDKGMLVGNRPIVNIA